MVTIGLWFLAGLASAAAVTLTAFYVYGWMTSRHKSMPAEFLPKSWDDLMPREARKAKPAAEPDRYKISQVGKKRKRQKSQFKNLVFGNRK